MGRIRFVVADSVDKSWLRKVQSESDILNKMNEMKGEILTRVEELRREHTIKRKSASKFSKTDYAILKDTLQFQEWHGSDDDFRQQVNPINYPHFRWAEGKYEVQQMPEAIEWMKDALGTKSMGSVAVKDSRNVTFGRTFEDAHYYVSARPDVTIEISRQTVCYIELRREEKGEIQAKAGALLYVESKNSALDQLVVLTDLRDFWQVYFFVSVPGEPSSQEALYIGELSRGIALGLIRKSISIGALQYKNYGITTLRGFDTVRSEEFPTSGPLSKRKKIIHPATSDILQLARLREIADNESEEHILNCRQRLLMLADKCASSAEPDFYKGLERDLCNNMYL
ncbi:hypothetical protein DFS34DRAFT_626815 [Phlyctochytrium arcticum]|nr:hypothetical protein DFS34DRAFT_626815 [Phlyctochytrium arcticum]